VILHQIFQTFDPEEYDAVQQAWDRIADIHSSGLVHHRLGIEYLKDPGARVIELALPRQCGKSTWIRQIAENYPRVMRVYPSMSVMRYHVDTHPVYRPAMCYTVDEIYRGATRGTALDIDLILLDDVYLDHKFLDNRDTIMETIYMSASDVTKIPTTVSLYTPK